jgi:hypothetical protein
LNRLAKVIKETGFMALEDIYAVMITDQPTVYTTVVMDGVKKVVSNYGNGGPPILWAIEELIDKLLLEAEWGQAHVNNELECAKDMPVGRRAGEFIERETRFCGKNLVSEPDMEIT